MSAVQLLEKRGSRRKVTPQLLTFWIGGFMGSDLELEWDGTRLRRRSSEATWKRLQESEPWEDLPSPEQVLWLELSQALEEVDAWAWPLYSNDPDVMDGTQWSMKLRWGTRRWSGGGSNAFPLGFGRIQELFERLARGKIEGHEPM